MIKYNDFSASYTDLIKFDKKPNEDYFLISKKYPIFVVADGVTNSHFPSGKYSFPSGAKAAAEIFCYSTIEFLEKDSENIFSTFETTSRRKKNREEEKKARKVIIQSFDFANQRIYELNKNEGILENLDYHIYDFFDTVGILAFILGKNLYYGYVGDCGLAILNSEHKLKFQTEDWVVKSAQYLYRLSEKNHWSEKEKHIFWRKNLRNHSSGKYYGTFDGEKKVKKYYKIGRKKLSRGDLVVLYSDGILEYLELPKFIRILREKDKKLLDEFTLKKAKENCKKYGTDRTFISRICD